MSEGRYRLRGEATFQALKTLGLFLIKKAPPPRPKRSRLGPLAARVVKKPFINCKKQEKDQNFDIFNVVFLVLHEVAHHVTSFSMHVGHVK